MAHKGTTVFTLTGLVSTLTGRLRAAFFDFYGPGQIVVALRTRVVLLWLNFLISFLMLLCHCSTQIQKLSRKGSILVPYAY